MSSQDNDDKPTVVLDFNALKEELKTSEELTVNINDIQFNVDFNDVEPLEDHTGDSKEVENQNPIYLFDYKTDFFEKVLPHHLNSANLHLITELEQLNQALSSNANCIVAFYYNNTPKAVNQLTKQIREKFTNARTLIVAKNLSEDKAAMHAKTKYAANAYLSHPFDINEFYQTIASLS